LNKAYGDLFELVIIVLISKVKAQGRIRLLAHDIPKKKLTLLIFGKENLEHRFSLFADIFVRECCGNTICFVSDLSEEEALQFCFE